MDLPRMRRNGVRATAGRPLHRAGGPGVGPDLKTTGRSRKARTVTYFVEDDVFYQMGIFTLLPLTSTMESSPVIEWPVEKMKNLSAAWSRNAGNPAVQSSPRRR